MPSERLSRARDYPMSTTLTATDLAVADAAQSADAPLLRARRAEVTIDLMDLLRLRVSPVRLALRQPALHLVRDAQGRWNLPQVPGGSGASLIELAAPRDVEVEGGEMIVDDLASPGVEGRIAALSARGTPGGVEFRGTASYDGGAPVTVSGEVGPFAALFRNGEDGAGSFPVRLTVGPETARASASGHIARPLDLAGVDPRVQG